MIGSMLTTPLVPAKNPISDHEPTHRTEIPEALQKLLCLLLIGGGLVSVGFVGEFSPLPMTTLLDVWVLLLAVWILFRGRIQSWVSLLLVLGYLAARGIAAVSVDPPLLDLLQAHRWLVYLAVFALARGHRWSRPELLTRLAWWLVGLATVKSVLTALTLGLDERPGLFLENNFELALFSGTAAVIHRNDPRNGIRLILLLGLLTLLSGSRSGALTYLVLVAFALWSVSTRDVFLRYLAMLTPVVAVVVPWVIFAGRAAESEVIDRVRFLEVFLSEVQRWQWLDWTFGTPPITPLSPQGCASLAYYDVLFSSAGDGQCYSVILHSFILRLLYDGGFLALLMALLLPLVIMRQARVPWGLTLTLLAIAVINSASVSGFNNPYVALPILLAVLTAGPREAVDPAAAQRPLAPFHAPSLHPQGDLR
ncbi:hypothetical protein [Nesterenkonia jeotgali]|uniref:O-antigen polymerase n=1 Tax=Nesterenkonia jeotgali TaxID=317018 RepID=A0A0W8ID33_9MICC|nr:hypothetical protein [Nesterenkonia jeotgali]KUG57862.1 hypothetical protein AVL63_04910 [Nesterenkonia jeotgali]